MRDKNAMVCRVLKIVIPVFMVSFIFNIPKFLEATAGYIYQDDENLTKNVTTANVIIKVTNLRLDPYYSIYYNNWARLMVLGVIPFVLVVFFNVKVYQSIHVRTPVLRLKYYYY